MIYLTLFYEFFMIGLFTFGGGYAMIPLVKDVVLKYNWLTEDQFYNFIGVCESTPGPIAINMATYVGSTTGGLLGSIIATLGVVLPSFIIIVLVASIMKKFIENKYFQYFLKGIKPVVLGLLISTGLVLVAKAIGYKGIETFNFDYVSFAILGILLIYFLLHKYVFKKKINNIVFILFAAFLGICSMFIF